MPLKIAAVTIVALNTTVRQFLLRSHMLEKRIPTLDQAAAVPKKKIPGSSALGYPHYNGDTSLHIPNA